MPTLFRKANEVYEEMVSVTRVQMEPLTDNQLIMLALSMMIREVLDGPPIATALEEELLERSGYCKIGKK